MKLTRKIVLTTLILTGMIGAAAASPAELTFFPEQSSTEIDSFTSYELTVENTGPVADVYHLSSSSPSEVTIAPKRVPENSGEVLEPGQTKTVNVWYNPGREREAGIHTFSVTARSQATDKKYTASAEVEVIKDHNVDVQVTDSMTGCLGENVIYNVNVTNQGIQQEAFQLTTREGKISQDSVNLQPGETQQVQVTVSSDKPVEKTFNILAASKTSYAQDIETVQFNAEQCYASDVSITPQNKEVDALTETEIDVTVRNTGTRADEFVLTSNVGEFDDTKLDIEGESSKQTTLRVTPQELGQQQIEVTAKSRVTSSTTTTLDVVNGMDAEVSFDEDRTRVCESESFDLDASIENTGAADETFRLSTNLGNLSEDEIEVARGDTETIEVEANSESLKKGTHAVNLTATADTFGQPTRGASTNLVVEDCWNLTMNVVPKVMSAGENRSVIYEVQLTNNGTRDNIYELSTEGPEWVSIKPEQIAVRSGERDKAFLYAGIPFKKKGEVEITAKAKGTQVERSETVRLLIGEEVKEAVESDKNEAPTGGFTDNLPSANVDLSNDAGKIAASIIIGLLITAGVLYHEW